jgi:hypothetical protein
MTMDLRKTSAALFAAMLLGATSTASLAQDNSNGGASGNQAGQSDTTGATAAPGVNSPNANAVNDSDDKGNQVRCDNAPGSEAKVGTTTAMDPAACPQ